MLGEPTSHVRFGMLNRFLAKCPRVWDLDLQFTETSLALGVHHHTQIILTIFTCCQGKELDQIQGTTDTTLGLEVSAWSQRPSAVLGGTSLLHAANRMNH